MRKIQRGDLIDLPDYERVRDDRRAAVGRSKQDRRIQLGYLLSIVFENRESMIYQIQEMCRAERITRAEKIDEEIEVYNELVPGGGELRATLMIEVTDREQMDREFSRLVGIEHHVWLVNGAERIHAEPLEPRERADRTSAVHFLRFPVAGLQPGARLEIDHPEYPAATPLSPRTIESLSKDLREE